MVQSINLYLLVLLFVSFKMMASFQRTRPVRSNCSRKVVFRCVSETSGPKVFRAPKFNKKRDGKGKPKGYFDVESRYSLELGLKSGQPENMLLKKPYIVLGIESSCDDTGVGIVTSEGKILSNVVYSQYAIHERFGGVVPSLAMEAHKNNINKALEEAMIQAGLTSLDQVDAIAVTKGPGLEICLRVGLRKAQEIAREYKKPLVTVHHLEAHCMVARLAGQEVLPALKSTMINKTTSNNHNDSSSLSSSSSSSSSTSSTPQQSKSAVTLNTNTTIISNVNDDTNIPRPFTPKVEFPFLTLLVSGGHTSILLCRGLGDHLVLGGTLDDALGEAFDKVSRMLGLKSEKSGGAAVEQQAEDYYKYYAPSKSTSQKPIAAELVDISFQIVDNNNDNDNNGINGHSNVTSDAGSSSSSTSSTRNTPIPPTKDKAILDLNLTVPMRDKPNCDFSYAGLKNGFRMAVMNTRSQLGLDIESTNAPSNQMESVSYLVSLPPEATALLCAGFQDVAFQHVEDRIKRAFYALEKLHLLSSITALVVVGGVASNKELRRRLLALLDEKYEDELYTYDLHSSRLIANAAKNNTTTSNTSSSSRRSSDGSESKNSSNNNNNDTNSTDNTSSNNNNNNNDLRRRGKLPKIPLKLPLIFPPIQLCTDNGVMVAWAGIEKLKIGISDEIEGQESIARWPIGNPVEDNSKDLSLFKKIS